MKSSVQQLLRLKRLNVAWWNTGLCPQSREPELGSRQAFIAGRVVQRLVRKRRCSVVALGETNASLLAWFKAHVGAGFRVHTVRSKRNLAMILDERAVELIAETPIRCRWEGREVEAGTAVRLNVHGSGPLVMLLAHWPSRRQPNANERRTKLGIELQRHAALQPGVPVIVAGDFNDEPFDRAMIHGLEGTRERLLSRRRQRLFNPSWSLFVEQPTVRGRVATGTHFFDDANQPSRWWLFDQFLVNPALLDGPLRLGERPVHLVCDRWLFQTRGPGLTSGFDHLPIVLSLKVTHDERVLDSTGHRQTPQPSGRRQPT